MPPNKLHLDIIAVKIKDPSNYALVLAVLCTTCGLYVIALVWARRQDRKDVQKVIHQDIQSMCVCVWGGGGEGGRGVGQEFRASRTSISIFPSAPVCHAALPLPRPPLPPPIECSTCFYGSVNCIDRQSILVPIGKIG